MVKISHEMTNVVEEGGFLTPPTSPVEDRSFPEFAASTGQTDSSQDIHEVLSTPQSSPSSRPSSEAERESENSGQLSRGRSVESRDARRRRRISSRVRHFLSLSPAETADLTAVTGLPSPVVRMLFAERRLRQIQRRLARQSSVVTGSLMTSNLRSHKNNNKSARTK